MPVLRARAARPRGEGLDVETVEIDLRDRPAWVYDLNATGRVPILDDGFVLPESAVIMEYLEERYPSPALLPADPAARAAARLAVFRFDALLGDDYYAFAARRPERARPRGWTRCRSGCSLFVGLRVRAVGAARPRPARRRAARARERRWVEELSARPAVARELEVVGALDVSDVELEELAARLGEVTIVDVRQPYEYDGSFGAPCDPRQGHIPGAVT